MNFIRNIILNPLVKFPNDDGWETSAGQEFKNIFYTANYFAGFSSDEGNTFKLVSPYDLAKSVGLKFCCDQVAHYVPAANTMVWILLSNEGPVIMCLASPDELKNSKGKSWTVYVLDKNVFSLKEHSDFDYPQVSFGDNFLYLTFNNSVGAIVCRFHVGQIRERNTLHFQYFIATNNSFLCPCQLSGNNGFFVTQNTTSQLRVFKWPENSNSITQHDVNISTIPTEDWKTLTPSGGDWFAPSTKIDTTVQGVARSGNQLWIAWTGARRVYKQEKNSFPYPHIGIAIIDIFLIKLQQQRYLWNEEYAFAYPSLASNPDGEVAITFMWGGGNHYINHGVGFMTGTTELFSTSNDNGVSGGGHYITARMAYPDINCFIGAGFNTPEGIGNHPRYVLFKR